MPVRLAEGRRKARSGMVEFGIPFSPEDADLVRQVAQRRKVSFSEAVRLLVTWGLEVDAEESVQ